MACFRLQGVAVRDLAHALVYHHMPQLYHCAPALAIMLSHDDHIQKWGEGLVDASDDIRRRLAKYWS